MECKVIKARFFSSVKEREWLNKLGQHGYLLFCKTENKYMFEQTDKQWYYSVEWLDCAADSEDAAPYVRSYAEQDVQLVATYSLWAYFASNHPLQTTALAMRRNAIHYRNTAFVLIAINVITAILTGYQFAIRPFLEKNAVFYQAPELEKTGNIFLGLAYRLWYGAERLMYFYTDFCSNFFGETKATFALGILIPLSIILSVMVAFWIREWLRNVPPKTNDQEEEHVCQESKTPGKA